MRLAELSSRSDLSTATIKYYLRLGLLPPGEARSSTWADYDETHVQRLRLVRALTEVGGLTLEQTRHALAAVDDEDRSLHDSLGRAQWLISPPPSEEPSEQALAQVDAWLARRGWQLREHGPLRARLAAQLDALSAVGFALEEVLLDEYADALLPVVEVEVAHTAELDRTAAVERLVLGTLLVEPVIGTVRRMAAEVASAAQTP